MVFDEEGACFPLIPFQFCLLLASVVKIHEYAKENEKTLHKLFSSHYHPLRLTSVLYLHHTFYFCHSSYHLPHFFLTFFTLRPLSLHLYMRFCGSPQRSVCAHTLQLQCAGDNEVSGKRGLGGVVGIIPAV